MKILSFVLILFLFSCKTKSNEQSSGVKDVTVKEETAQQYFEVSAYQGDDRNLYFVLRFQFKPGAPSIRSSEITLLNKSVLNDVEETFAKILALQSEKNTSLILWEGDENQELDPAVKQYEAPLQHLSSKNSGTIYVSNNGIAVSLARINPYFRSAIQNYHIVALYDLDNKLEFRSVKTKKELDYIRSLK